MPFIPTPRGVEAVVKYDQNGVPVVNVFNIDTQHAVTATDLTLIANALAQWWDTVAYLYFHSSLVIQEIVATDISVANGQQVTVSTFTHAAGNQSGAAAGANVAAVTTWRTAFTGRSFRGRTYWGGLPQAYLMDAQTLTGAALTNLGAVAAAVEAAVNALGFRLSVLSKFALKVARVAGLLTEIITIVMDNKVDSQRRRTAN